MSTIETLRSAVLRSSVVTETHYTLKEFGFENICMMMVAEVEGRKLYINLDKRGGTKLIGEYIVNEKDNININYNLIDKFILLSTHRFK